MDLRAHILSLVAPARIGEELSPGIKLLGASTELGPRLTFLVEGREVHVDIEPVTADRPSAARSRRLMFSYRVMSGDERVPSTLGRALCLSVARAAERHEDAVLDAMERDASMAILSTEGATRIREVTVDRLLEAAGSPDRRYYTLSPYVGCLIGCRFCYAQSRVGIARRLQRLPETPWGSYVDVRINAPEVLRRELEVLPPAPLKFCPIVSDPYQAVERRYEVTRRCLLTLRDARPSPTTFVLTRSTLLARDAELIASLRDARVGVSIPTVDDETRRHFEPRGASIEGRLELLRTLRALGVRTFAVVQPLLPGSIEGLADALAATVESVSIEVLRGLEGAGDDFGVERYAEAASDDWQMANALALERLLIERGVKVWRGELPADLGAGP
jgi:DNA repair photolyase